MNEQISFFKFPVSKSPSNEEESQNSSQIFSDEILDYIKQLFMEEDFEVLQSHPDLEATEKPFYDLIGEKYPFSPDQSPPEISGENRTCNTISNGIDFFQSNSEFAWYQNCDFSPSHQSLGLQEDQFTNLFFRYLPTSEFHKGVEEAKKFLPKDLAQADLTLQQDPIEAARRKQNRSSDEDSRRSKQSASFSEEPTVPSETLDELLLCSGDKFPKIVKAIRQDFYKEAIFTKELTTRRKSSKTKQPKKAKDAEEADIQTLLLLCAQTAANYDSRRAHELLNQIRQHSSPRGDASQRLAHYFADGLAARLAGTGSELYHSLAFNQKTLKDALSAYKLYLASCPFKKISYHFANQIILDTIQDADRVHILDFGIYFGFQWPVFIKLLSLRSGGPPKLRITGIDIPQPGFRPTKMIEETGRRLTDYAQRFGVPFEYHGIAAKFDEINIKELSLHEEEMLIANCLFRLHNPADETVFEECPRDKVLNTIRKLNPAVFVNVVLNGTYGAPLFMTRVREALYHFSAVFDMIDATTIRESETRLMVERDLYGRLLINAISCEGLERERPETYRQWQVRCLRAGFGMAPNKRGFVKKVRDGVRSMYHKDFCMDEDDRWLVVGWKGRILYALSAWIPT